MEVAVRAQYARLHVEEEPIIFVDRLYGKSKLGPSEFVGFLKGLARLLLTL
jgi:dolichol-phosphate mannosyltransferase